MNPGDDHELRLLYAHRGELVDRSFSDQVFDVSELQWVSDRIDALEMAQYYGLQYSRCELIWWLRKRHFDLLLSWAKDLLE